MTETPTRECGASECATEVDISLGSPDEYYQIKRIREYGGEKHWACSQECAERILRTTQ